jgi:apolipoprotein N-acyltransferase
MTDIIDVFEIFSLILILVAFALFARLAIKGKSLGSFRFQLSIFMLIWVLSEIPHIFSTLGLIDTASYSDIGLYLHATSMAVFALFVGWRSIKFLAIHPTPPAGEVSVATKRPEGLRGGMD